ncbi:hypothetical protein COO60DRAFT_1545545 [Scenedesmus sp. NREL 46B-D3]|nr:hypothetical protein COO60DRAFT_1545545 [Scenedesmus sp. NREL 46B-D3]
MGRCLHYLMDGTRAAGCWPLAAPRAHICSRLLPQWLPEHCRLRFCHILFTDMGAAMAACGLGLCRVVPGARAIGTMRWRPLLVEVTAGCLCRTLADATAQQGVADIKSVEGFIVVACGMCCGVNNSYFFFTGSCRLHISEGNLPVVVLSTCMYFVRALFWHRGPCGRCVTERWLGIMGGSIRLLKPWRMPWWPAAPPAAAGGRWRAWNSQAVVFTAGFATVRGVAFLEAAGDHIANKKCCILMAFFVVALLSDQPAQRWLRWCGSDKTRQLDDVFGSLHVLASKKLG